MCADGEDKSADHVEREVDTEIDAGPSDDQAGDTDAYGVAPVPQRQHRSGIGEHHEPMVAGKDGLSRCAIN